MGMVSRKIFLKAGSKIPGSARVSILLLCLLILLFIGTVESRRNGCRVDQCNRKYERGNRRLHAKEDQYSESDFKKKHCRVLKRYQRCLHHMQRVCRGNLLFHSVLQINTNNLNRAHCSLRSNKKLVAAPEHRHTTATTQTPPSNTTNKQSPVDVATESVGSECQLIKDPHYRHCGMFGDPHLRTFSDRFYTCNVVKAWQLVENDHMTVMATNFPVEEGSEATVTTQITVLIKEHANCAEQRTFVATSEQLPGAFVDGSSVSGSVFVVEVEQGRHVEIHVRYVATTIIIRRLARYLTFAIRLPDQLVLSSSDQQLCVSGCPRNQVKRNNLRAERHSPPFSENKNRSKRDVDADQLGQDIVAEVKDDVFVAKQYFTKESAGKLCKQIILDVKTEDDGEEMKLKSKTSHESSQAIKKSEAQASHASIAFSALESSPNNNDLKRKKSRRRKPKHGRKSNSDPNLSSFRQLRWSHESESDAILSEITSGERRRKKKRRRTKHDVSKPRDRSTSVSTDRGCGDLNNEISDFNFYFDSCVFDLTTTGDANFTFTAKAALEDVKHTHALGLDAPGTSLDVVKMWKPAKEKCERSDSQTKSVAGRDGNGGSAKRSDSALLFLCVMLACMCVNYSSIFFASSNASEASRKSLKRFRKRTEKFLNSLPAT